MYSIGLRNTVLAAAACTTLCVSSCANGDTRTGTAPTSATPVTEGTAGGPFGGSGTEAAEECQPTSVLGRAAAPTQTDAPGIVLDEPGSFSVNVGGETVDREIVIEMEDWNTIVDTSQVCQRIGLALDPDMNAAATTRNRFQYLVNQIEPYVDEPFLELGIASGFNSEDDVRVLIAALINTNDSAIRVDRLAVSIRAQGIATDGSAVGPPVTVASGIFYQTPGTELIIAPHVAHIAYLTFSDHVPNPEPPSSLSFDFDHDIVYCGAICSTR